MGPPVAYIIRPLTSSLRHRVPAGAWVSLAEGGLVVDDDEALSKLLTGIEGIHFLRVPPPLGKPAGRRARRARAWPL
jgi:hypothetical protein